MTIFFEKYNRANGSFSTQSHACLFCMSNFFLVFLIFSKDAEHMALNFKQQTISLFQSAVFIHLS